MKQTASRQRRASPNAPGYHAGNSSGIFGRSRIRSTAGALVLAAWASVACSNQRAEPEYASSAGETGYAERYPDELATLRGRLNTDESRAQQNMAAFSTYPDELSNPNWREVATLVERADRAGQSADYARRVEENNQIARFYQEEHDTLSKKVGGAAQYVVKQKNCDVDVYGTTVAALDRAVDKDLEDRLRARNEASRIIEDNPDSLGRQNLEKLHKQADEIAYTSYLSHLGVKETRRRIKQHVDEGSEVKKTLARSLDESRKIEADPNHSEGERRAAHARAQAAEAASQRLDSELQQAEYVLKEVDDRVKKLESDYAASLSSLKQHVEENAKRQAGTPKS